MQSDTIGNLNFEQRDPTSNQQYKEQSGLQIKLSLSKITLKYKTQHTTMQEKR